MTLDPSSFGGRFPLKKLFILLLLHSCACGLRPARISGRRDFQAKRIVAPQACLRSLSPSGQRSLEH